MSTLRVVVFLPVSEYTTRCSISVRKSQQCVSEWLQAWVHFFLPAEQKESELHFPIQGL